MGVKAITGPQLGRYGGFHSFKMVKEAPPSGIPAEGQRPLTFRMGRITFSLKFFEMVILSLIWTSPVEKESKIAYSQQGPLGNVPAPWPIHEKIPVSAPDSLCDPGQHLRLYGPWLGLLT